MLSLQLFNFEKRSNFGFQKMQVLLKLGVVYTNDNKPWSSSTKGDQFPPIRWVILFGLFVGNACDRFPWGCIVAPVAHTRQPKYIKLSYFFERN
jgi:hypothetical protein